MTLALIVVEAGRPRSFSALRMRGKPVRNAVLHPGEFGTSGAISSLPCGPAATCAASAGRMASSRYRPRDDDQRLVGLRRRETLAVGSHAKGSGAVSMAAEPHSKRRKVLAITAGDCIVDRGLEGRVEREGLCWAS